MRTINIAKDFSTTPVGRYVTDGPHSGANFREKFLKEPVQQREQITLILDGAEGYPSSFLEEAFGGLVREGYADAETLSKILTIQVREPEFERYRHAIWRYINNARPK